MLGGLGAGIVVATATAASSATRDPDKTVNTAMIVNRLAAAALLAGVLALVFGLAARMDLSGRVGTLVMGVYIVGVALGPVVGGNLVGVVGPHALGLVIAVPSLAFGALLFAISRRSGVSERGRDLPEAARGQEPAAATVE
ncbi:hypothetical protein [Arthrobacter mangrovi]|uniref:Major facilitator superfamily (MFS) profile domain-containing protein n=1 Tax=Arthrobacter mangrovi TaxID=2966350 RepID=A0ABQ5MP67_9MICC|nr:hypothetical protein [Arthrobacter mangrovi]GLB65775.1 hypothetical protein AHIS1636_02140 [Arthrobacter mangrovi]